MTGKKSKPGNPTTGNLSARSRLVWPEAVDLPQAAIRIVGLGPGPVEALSLAAWQTLVTAPRLILRTTRHPVVAELPSSVAYTTCDELYEAHDTFDAVYAEIVQRVVAVGREPGGVVYAVPGHPWVGEATTPLILNAAAQAGLTTAIVDGLSFVEPCFAAARVDLMDGSQVIDAMLLAQQHHPRLDPGLPLLVGQVYSRQVASDVKLTLLGAYPDEHPVQVLRAAGGRRQSIHAMSLYELDRQDIFDHLTTLYVPPLPLGSSFSHLEEIVAHLRAPEGCPWDREQTLDSLKQDLLGECVEVLEAIDLESSSLAQATRGGGDHGADNSEHIGEELGDLLLVATMMIRIATEEGRFRMGDVTRGIVEKLIRRHPHVFGPSTVDNVGQVVTNWDAIKAAEKAAKGLPDKGPLDEIPAHLPALEKARVIQSKAEKAGLLQRAELATQARAALPDLMQRLARTEVQPGKEALRGEEATADDAATTYEAIADTNAQRALGELLWRITALAHALGVNAEDALRAYTVAYREEAYREETSGEVANRRPDRA